MLLVIDRATGELVCELDLMSDGMMAYPAGLNYMWAEPLPERAPSLQAEIGDEARWTVTSQEPIFRGAPT
jgi:hypothetical protein